MANEHTLHYETHLPIQFTCADGAGIEKGTLLKLSDPLTVEAADGNNDIVGGVAATEKIASDGKTKISVYRGGVFKATASGSITVGNPLVVSGPTANNLLEAGAVDDENVVGIALETASDGETFLYELNPVVMNLS